MAEQYVVFGAKIACSCGLRESKVVLQKDHGVFIRKKEQINAKDKEGVQNIVPFGGCTSASNPSTQKTIQTMQAELDTEMGKGRCNAAAAGCAGACTPVITSVEWEEGYERTEVDEEKTVSDKSCTLTCQFGGKIKLLDAGQS